MWPQRQGSPRPVVYRCFANGEHMVAALGDREKRRLAEGLAAAPAAATPITDPAQALHRLMEAYFTAVTGVPDSYRLVHGPAALADRIGGIDQARAGAGEHLTSVLTAWLDDSAPGLSAAGDRTASGLAALAVGVAEAGARLLLDPGQNWKPTELADLATAMFTGGVPRTFAIPAIGGFLLALGLMLFPPSFDNNGHFQEQMSCGVPALFDQQAFTKQKYGSDGEPGELGTSRCAATVAAREHQAVGALAVATPLGLLALALHLHRRTGPAR
ncbi:hypothetical protein [Streptomyces sp. NPDC050485]|uniref:hypothetical protein n=1 Tax=Streptomyces sp. NPDC050485 TaxID=3365617 RepID=UPI0037A12EAF